MKHHTFSGTKLLYVRPHETAYDVVFTQCAILMEKKDIDGLTIGKTYDITIKERDDERSTED